MDVPIDHKLVHKRPDGDFEYLTAPEALDAGLDVLENCLEQEAVMAKVQGSIDDGTTNIDVLISRRLRELGAAGRDVPDGFVEAVKPKMQAAIENVDHVQELRAQVDAVNRPLRELSGDPGS
jgi:hypothetical protein